MIGNWWLPQRFLSLRWIGSQERALHHSLPAVIARCPEESCLEYYLPSSRICKYPVPLPLCVTCKDNQEKRKQSRVTIGFKDLANMILPVISLSPKLMAV